VGFLWNTLWKTNIAIEIGNLYWIYPLKMVIFIFFIGMLVYQRVSRECSKEHPSHPWDAALAACHIQLLQRFVAILLAVLHAGDEGSDDHSCHSGSL
jgi:hypothetical protein